MLTKPTLLAQKLLNKNYADCSFAVRNRLLRLSELMDNINWWTNNVPQSRFSNLPWLLVDEGFVQRLAALEVNKLNSISQFKSVSVVFDIKVAEEVAFDRVIERANSSGRLAQRHKMMSLLEIQNDLNRFRYKLDKLVSNNAWISSKYIEIDASDPLSENVKKISKELNTWI